MPVIITARTRSEDPAQEHLRERKAVWNKACSAFIARLNAFKPQLIAFKQGLNGKGNAKVGLPPSNIKEPLPSEIGGYMGMVNSKFNELASEFAGLVSESNAIMQEQAQYADHRRKPQPRQPRQPRQADLAQVDDILISEGSNKATRFWAQLSSYMSSDETNRYRLSMLKLSYKIFQNLVKFEDLILTSDIGDMEKVLNAYLLIANNLDTLKHDVNKIVKLKHPDVVQSDNSAQQSQQTVSPTKSPPTTQSLPAKPPGSPVKSPATKSQSVNAMNMHQLFKEVQSMLTLGFTVADVKIFLDLYHANKTVKDPNKMALVTDRLRDIYYELFDNLKLFIENEIEQKLPKNITLEEIRNLQANASNDNSDITKLAGNFVSRYYNKYRHEHSKDASSASRIEIYNIVREMKINIDTIMNLLENKHLNSGDLIAKITETDQLMAKISEPLNRLNMLYKDKYYEPGSNKRKHNILDPAGRFFNRQIQRDVDKPGW
jgi:hypothetical protein